jgi:hypothetical protein
VGQLQDHVPVTRGRSSTRIERILRLIDDALADYERRDSHVHDGRRLTSP